MHKKTISIMLCLALLLSAIVFAIPAWARAPLKVLTISHGITSTATFS